MTDTRAGRWYRRMLRVYPPRFRGQFEDDMTAAFEAEVSEVRGAGVGRRVVFVVTTVRDLVVLGCRERLLSFMKRRVSASSKSRPVRRSVARAAAGVPSVPIGQAFRGLRKAPRFSLTVVFTLGVGLGAGGSVFALLDLLLLRPPPHVADASRLRRLTLTQNRPPFGEFTTASLAWVDYEAVSRAPQLLDGVAVWFTLSRSLGRGVDAQSITVTLVTPSFFSVLGVQPALGRFFQAEEDREGVAEVPCVASERFWRRDLGGGPGALGTRLLVGNVSCSVVGVAPRGFRGVELGAVDLWLPIRATGADFQGPDPAVWTTDRNHWIRIVARLADEVGDDAAADEATAAYRGFTPRGRDPELNARARWESIMPGKATFRTSAVNVTALLLGGAGLLLLLIVANLANLFVVREIGRARDTAVRMALGISTSRLFVMRAIESAMLAMAAALVGVAVTVWLAPVVRALVLPGIDVDLGWVTLPVALGTVTLAFGIGMAVATVSAIHVGRTDPAELLRAAGSARAGTSRTSHTMRLGLVSFQAALSAALLIASLAFVQSFRRAATFDLGFDREGVIVATVPLSNLGYDDAQQRDFYRGVYQRLQSAPGIESASLGYMTPWYDNRGEPLSEPGRDSLPEVPRFGAPAFDAVTPDYLKTMRIRLLAGRWFTEGDRSGTTPVLAVNQALAALYWPGESALGKCLWIGDHPTPCREIVGVIANHRFTGTLEDGPVAAYFLPLAQSDAYGVIPKLFVRVARHARDMLPSIRQMVQGAAPGLPAATLFTLDTRYEPLLAAWRLGSYALTALGALAMVIASTGLFSVLAHLVAARRREFAIRSAIGATVWQIAIPMLRQGLLTATIGVAVALLLVLVTGRSLEPLLFRTHVGEPVILGIAAVLLLSIAALASAGPARRAGRQDPMEVLRTE